MTDDVNTNEIVNNANRERPAITKRQMEYLVELSKFHLAVRWTGPLKAMGNKLVGLGLAEAKLGYPVAFVISDKGRELVKEYYDGKS